ncbi:MAG TPA: rhomboid family intramembrane serine protease [bacterium]|jgi:rhomboid protease GluP|nr:rhomboid family intramembrane serine protease [bacterium]
MIERGSLRDQRGALEALARWLSVRGGFEPLPQVLPGTASLALGLFDACLARFEGGDLRVHALLADEGGDLGFAVHRAESFRASLKAAEPLVRGRLKVCVWLIVADAARAAELRGVFLRFEDGHFLAKTVVGRGILCVGSGEGEFSGRTQPKPSARELAGVLLDASADPGPDEAERVREARESAALNRHRDERSAAMMLRPGPSPATWSLMAVNVACYAAQMFVAGGLVGQGVSPDVAASTAMLKLGANEPGLTLQSGEWWRVLTSAFLHGGWWHLGMNMYALFLVGAVLERLVGPWRFVAFYLFAAVVAGLASALLGTAGSSSVGASGAIMGLIGLLMAPRFKRDPRFPELLAGRLFQWLVRPVIFVFMLGLGLRLFDVPLLLDNAAHLGGLLAGFALGYLWPSFLVRPTRRRA